MIYHWVVCFDQETNKFEIDWDMTYHALDGIVYDPSKAFGQYAWKGVDEDEEELFESLSTDLAHSLDKTEIN
jgi:hypothetical protein